jgi:hypothetical protein
MSYTMSSAASPVTLPTTGTRHGSCPGCGRWISSHGLTACWRKFPRARHWQRRYAVKLKPQLLAYTEDRRLEINNNLAENALRGIAVGRKN